MNQVNELDKAELKVQMRNLYREHGLMGAAQALFEICVAAELLLQVMSEEIKNEFE